MKIKLQHSTKRSHISTCASAPTQHCLRNKERIKSCRKETTQIIATSIARIWLLKRKAFLPERAFKTSSSYQSLAFANSKIKSPTFLKLEMQITSTTFPSRRCRKFEMAALPPCVVGFEKAESCRAKTAAAPPSFLLVQIQCKIAL